jgi:hypothetical protein
VNGRVSGQADTGGRGGGGVAAPRRFPLVQFRLVCELPGAPPWIWSGINRFRFNYSVRRNGNCETMKAILCACLFLIAASAPAKEPFLKQEKTVPPKLEWNREIVSKKGGRIRFRVSSPEPFGVTLVADRSYKALLRGDKAGMKLEDFVLTTDCRDPVFEKTVQLKPGSYWFILANQSNKKVEMKLECAEGEKSVKPGGSGQPAERPASK